MLKRLFFQRNPPVRVLLFRVFLMGSANQFEPKPTWNETDYLQTADDVQNQNITQYRYDYGLKFSLKKKRHFMLKYILDLFLMCLINISYTWRVCICVRERKKEKERRGDQCTTRNKIFLATCECVWWVKCEKIMGLGREWVFFLCCIRFATAGLYFISFYLCVCAQIYVRIRVRVGTCYVCIRVSSVCVCLIISNKVI